jgi:hypothetical protein
MMLNDQWTISRFGVVTRMVTPFVIVLAILATVVVVIHVSSPGDESVAVMLFAPVFAISFLAGPVISIEAIETRRRPDGIVRTRVQLANFVVLSLVIEAAICAAAIAVFAMVRF